MQSSASLDSVGSVNSGSGTLASAVVTTIEDNDLTLMVSFCLSNPGMSAHGGNSRMVQVSNSTTSQTSFFYQAEVTPGAATQNSVLATAEPWAAIALGIRAPQPVARGGVFSDTSTPVKAVVSGLGLGEGQVHSSIQAVASGYGVGGGNYQSRIALTKPGTGTGGFSTAVTLFVYANSSALYPITVRHESGGITSPTIQLSQDIFAFSVDALTSPYAEYPPPDGGIVKKGIP
jgi:hypothetical protein